jgi:hypothetical protein
MTAVLADSGWSYVAAGYVVSIGGLAVYALAMLRRGRRLSSQVPPEERRWM